MSITFLTLEQILTIHRDQITRYGGAPDVRDWPLLHSALAMPQAGFGGQLFHTDLYEMAAAYLFHLTANHPFFDGNKRVGTVAADIFLALNGLTLIATQDEVVELVLSVARGEAAKSLVAEFLRSHAQPR